MSLACAAFAKHSYWFPDIRLSGTRQSDFCPSTYAYHTFAYQDLCLSETEFEIRTIAHQGGTFAYQKLMSVNIFVYVYIVCPSQNLNGETKKGKLFEEFCKILLCIQAFLDTSLEEAMARTSGPLF